MQNLAVVTTSPLMKPVILNDEIYFTSQYFHKMYGVNGGEKYVELKNFNKLIRSLETYENYVATKDIVELARDDKGRGSNLESLIISNSYNPIMLINATAQVALTHHLDDEISKSASISINTKAANDSIIGEFSYTLQDKIAAQKILNDALNISESSKIALFADFNKKNGNVLALPSYAVDSGVVSSGSRQVTMSATELLKLNNSPLSAKKFNILAVGLDILETKTRKSTNGTKEFKALTEKGLAYGKNLTSPNNPRETQPHWYESSFGDLLTIMGDI